MRKSSKFAALALSAALALGIATPAFAAGTTELPTVNKTLEVNNGSSVTATFKYEATFLPSVAISGSNAPAGLTTEASGPSLSIAEIPLTAENKAVDGTGALTFGNFEHAGFYAYKITETADTYTGIGEMQYDDTVYTLLVSHDNDGNNTYYIYEGDLSKGIDVSKEKADGLDFTNKYTETTHEQDTPTDLVITKKVAGAQGDKTKKFSFTVTFDASKLTVFPLKDDGTPMSADEVLAAITAEGVTIENGVAKFELADGESVTFSTIVAGVTYSIDEEQETGYTKSYEAVANGTESSEQSNLLIGEKANTGTMTNTFQDITITGLFLNNAPFILMGAVAVAGVVLYGAAKRKLVA